ncbi:MAG TPA: hypothetical protein VK541_01570 [Pedobacter sp.]|nr:hypothetical protein [Pedobacter sp.]HMI01137.1 hypothetical protein [Pedobacter sp.]
MYEIHATTSFGVSRYYFTLAKRAESHASYSTGQVNEDASRAGQP